MSGSANSNPPLKARLEAVRRRVEAACERSGRSADSVRIVAVTKYAPLDAVRELVEVGHPLLGESRPQQLIERAGLLAPTARWHLIGHLQRNKVRAVLPVVELIHSVDSLRLLERISQIAEELKLTPRLLLQVNVSGEESKHGFAPEELRESWSRIASTPHVNLCGLMTMAPLTDETDHIRRTFRGLKSLRDELQAATPELPLEELSMGMSHDFEIAVEEGATLVRVGSVLFSDDQSG
jgi:PLP dependent protein